jgi:hypothetical protein
MSNRADFMASGLENAAIPAGVVVEDGGEPFVTTPSRNAPVDV